MTMFTVKTGHRIFLVQDDKWIGLRRNGYQAIYEMTQEQQEELINSLQDPVITFATATTNEQKKVLLEISKTIYRDYKYPSQYETTPFFSAARLAKLHTQQHHRT